MIELFAKESVCKDCGYTGNLRKRSRANELIALILLLFFILPGLIYLIWGWSSRACRCPQCKGSNVIPADSPVGRQLVQAPQASLKQSVHIPFLSEEKLRKNLQTLSEIEPPNSDGDAMFHLPGLQLLIREFQNESPQEKIGLGVVSCLIIFVFFVMCSALFQNNGAQLPATKQTEVRSVAERDPAESALVKKTRMVDAKKRQQWWIPVYSRDRRRLHYGAHSTRRSLCSAENASAAYHSVRNFLFDHSDRRLLSDQPSFFPESLTSHEQPRQARAAGESR